MSYVIFILQMNRYILMVNGHKSKHDKRHKSFLQLFCDADSQSTYFKVKRIAVIILNV